MTNASEHPNLRKILAALEGLGLTVEDIPGGDYDHRGRILHEGDPVAAYSFSVGEPGYSFIVHPSDGSYDILAQAQDRTDAMEPKWDNEKVDQIEALFRGLLVERGAIPAREFPTDYALRKWVSMAATVSLPRERGARSIQDEGVVVRWQEAPGSRFPSKGPSSEAIVRAARLQAQKYDRSRALEIAISAASDPRPHGDMLDPASGWLVRSSRVLLRGRLRDMALAWECGSGAKAVTGLAGQRDDTDVPYEADAPASSAIAP